MAAEVAAAEAVAAEAVEEVGSTTPTRQLATTARAASKATRALPSEVVASNVAAAPMVTLAAAPTVAKYPGCVYAGTTRHDGGVGALR